VDGSEIKFYSTKGLQKHTGDEEIKSRILPVEDSNTSIGYNNSFFLKMYRHVDRATNPDVEITRFLTEQVKFPQVPDFIGAIEWHFQKDVVVLGMMQNMVEYHGNGRSFIFERLNNFHERIAARTEYPQFQLKENLSDPVEYEKVPEDLKEFVSGTVAEGVRLLGVRTGEMHKALASSSGLVDFKPEDFSLHYQRSLFAGLQSLVREAFQRLERNLNSLTEEARQEAHEVLARKDEILSKLKRIYTKKIDVVKIRVHGNFHLRKILFTGKDVAILDFGGDPSRSYSERRLKRSPLRDVASMVRSFYYAAYEGLLLKSEIGNEERQKLKPFVDLWIDYVSGYFIQAYLDTAAGSSFIPDNKEDLEILLQTFLLQKALQSLNYELNNRVGLTIVPLRLIKSIMK
jgi:maltose alpha-D-glucosyltransferase / alpha-amylase